MFGDYEGQEKDPRRGVCVGTCIEEGEVGREREYMEKDRVYNHDDGVF